MPPTPAASECQTACPAVPTCPPASSQGSPRLFARTDRQISRPLRSTPDYQGFTATTSRSASRCRDGTQRLRFPPYGALPLAPGAFRRQGGSVGIRLPTFHAEAADRTRAASMPDTAWPVNGLPPGSSRTHLTDPVLMSAACFDTSSAVRSRSPSRSPPDAFSCAFSPTLTTTVFSQRSLRRFDITPRRATPKGQTFISCTAPHPARFPTPQPHLQRSWRT